MSCYLISNGVIVTPTELVRGHDLFVRDDRIERIAPAGSLEVPAGCGRVDAHGGYVTPGLIDIHSDYIEQVISPRPTVLIDIPTGLFEAERVLLSHGITTMFHSLSLYGDDFMDTKPARAFSNVCKLIDLIDQAKRTEGHNEHLIRHRCHTRFEIDNVGLVDQVIALMEAGKVDELSFMDHTPGQGQYRDLEVFRASIRSDHEVTIEEARERAEEQQRAPKITLGQMERMATCAREHGLAIASHDDDSVEKLDLMASLGCTISEFPISLDVARAACERGMSTVLGTPNILLGKSHSGNLSARQAVQAGVASVLCSDYYPTAMLHSAFKMRDDFGLPLEQAFALLTINPARAVGIDRDLGSLEEGKKADILVVREVPQEDGQTFPAITTTLVDGRVVGRSWYPGLPSLSARYATSETPAQA